MKNEKIKYHLMKKKNLNFLRYIDFLIFLGFKLKYLNLKDVISNF